MLKGFTTDSNDQVVAEDLMLLIADIQDQEVLMEFANAGPDDGPSAPTTR